MCLTLPVVGEILCRSTASFPEPRPPLSNLGRAEGPRFSPNKDIYKHFIYIYVCVHLCTCCRVILPWAVQHNAVQLWTCVFPGIKVHRGRIFKAQICSQPEPNSARGAAELGACPPLGEGCVVCAACKHLPGIREK